MRYILIISDIIFLKKRDSIRERDEDWIHLAEDENGLTYNKYFVDHPEMVLGSMEEVSGRFGNTIACLSKENADLKELLTKASEEISKEAKYEEIELLDDEISTIPATDDVKNFSYTIIDDEVYYRENSLFVKKEVTEKNKEKITPRSGPLPSARSYRRRYLASRRDAVQLRRHAPRSRTGRPASCWASWAATFF